MKNFPEKNEQNIKADEDKAEFIEKDGVKVKSSGISKMTLVVFIIASIIALLFFAYSVITDICFSKVNSGELDLNNIEVKQQVADMSFYNQSYESNQVFTTLKEEATEHYNDTASNIKVDSSVFNYVLIGNDDFTGTSNNPKADMILVASLNKRDNRVTYATIEGNTLVYIPNLDKVGPLKDAYEWGGATLLVKTIQNNFGIEIRGFCDISMKALVAVIDEVDGVKIELSDEQIQNANKGIQVFNVAFGENISLISSDEDGYAVLNGLQTLAYLRGFDADREIAVKNVLMATFSASIKNGYNGIMNYVDALTGNAVTSIAKDDISTLVRLSLSTLKNSNVNIITVSKQTTSNTFKLGSKDACNIKVSDSSEILVDALY